MKTKFSLLTLILVVLLANLAYADDGAMFRRNVSHTPDLETERANINHMSFYVPAQSSDGTLLGEGTEGIPYYLDEDGDNQGDTLWDTRYYAKPLVAVYIDSLPEEEAARSGTSFGAHDAYAAHSLDDGTTWKRTNLSLSAHLSSFNLANGEAYPGDAHNMTFAIAGDKVLVGWISKYCDGGSPLYTMTDEEVDALQEAFGLPDLYVRDIWGVAGSQSSVDYTGQGFPEVGEIPYSCVWSARGQLLEVDAEGVPNEDGGYYDIIWTKAERLTSGRRDANRLEMACDSAAGCMMTWQEDPEGLRPGQGLGPGAGWSGAVVNQQTDLWYSFIPVEQFTKVMTSDTDPAPIDMAEYIGDTTPKVAVPMAMPIRLTDNKMCKETGSDPYCYVNFDEDDPYGSTVLPDVDWDDSEAVKSGITQSADSTFCTDTVSWTTPGGNTLSLCEAEDGRVLGGRVGASRPRVNVQPYDSTIDGTYLYDSAIVIMGAEESKALGEGSVDDTDGDEIIEPEDIGKNMWYYSFDFRNPEFLMQGGMLNWPAKDPATGELFETLEDDFGNKFYETEISRRFSHMSQPIHQIGDAGISSVLIVKQGILNQGGPADIFLRLTKVPDDLLEDCDLDANEETTEKCVPEGFNPYAYENLVCDEWAYADGSNPRYIQGLCLSTGINVSGVTWTGCEGDCTQFPWDGGVSPFPKVTMWEQTVDNLDDESWENPFDVAKGHRGFIDGDFIMMMYAWSPNWQANAVGNDHYNLYARRSFDGGATWTTTPAELGGDGTETCENYKQADGEIVTTCTDYGAGEFEQARNLSQLIGNKETILDPRYTPTGGLKMLPITDLKGIGFTGYDDDVRDPSKFFIVYETGDNTTVAEGEATPLDLFYSRATNWGDDYFLVEYTSSTDPEDVTMGFDWLEHDREDLSGEAANTCNNGGTLYYVIWNQWQEDEFENVSNSDAWFRRVLFNELVEADPYATILYQSTDRVDLSTWPEDELIVLVGSGKDNDGLGPGSGIDNVRWWSDIEGHECNERTWQFPPRGLIPGWHEFSFAVQDNEGHWSQPKTARILIAEQFHNIYLPLIAH